MLDLTQLKPGDLITNPEKTHVYLILKLMSKVDNYVAGVKTLHTLVLDKNGNIIKDVLFSDLDQLCGTQ